MYPWNYATTALFQIPLLFPEGCPSTSVDICQILQASHLPFPIFFTEISLKYINWKSKNKDMHIYLPRGDVERPPSYLLLSWKLWSISFPWDVFECWFSCWSDWPVGLDDKGFWKEKYHLKYWKSKLKLFPWKKCM